MPNASASRREGGLRQRREPPLNASSFKWGNPTNGLARLCAIYAPDVLDGFEMKNSMVHISFVEKRLLIQDF
ncbi:MAG: hypothetical protein V7L25_13245 [Nostoc sp.]